MKKNYLQLSPSFVPPQPPATPPLPLPETGTGRWPYGSSLRPVEIKAYR
jgi:hypothetical protein